MFYLHRVHLTKDSYQNDTFFLVEFMFFLSYIIFIEHSCMCLVFFSDGHVGSIIWLSFQKLLCLFISS
jgi:hypothetical protein